jgi:hypothetical protein
MKEMKKTGKYSNNILYFIFILIIFYIYINDILYVY